MGLSLPKPVPAPPAQRQRIARTGRPRKQRKTTLASLKRTLWKLVSKYVRERDGAICLTCRNEPADQAGHFYSRALASTWIDPKNLAAQGPRCNLYLHSNPGPFAEYIVKTYGPEELARLTHRANKVQKQWRHDELRRLIAAFKEGGGAAFEMAYYEENLW